MRYIFIFFIFISFNGYTKSYNITGQVMDLRNNPIETATIGVVGRNSTTTTDNMGLFLLTIANAKKGDNFMLRISKEGYKNTSKLITTSSVSFPIKLFKIKNYKPLIVKPKTEETNKLVQNSPPPQIFNVSSNGQSGGITAGQVNIGQQPRFLNQKTQNDLLTFLTIKEEKITIMSLMGNVEAANYAEQISQFLKNNGYKNISNGQAMWTPAFFGQKVYRDTLGVSIYISSTQ